MRNMARDQRTALAPSKKLPVGDMLGEAYRSVFGTYRRDLQVAALRNATDWTPDLIRPRGRRW